jgi:hypothetical protein
MGEGGRKFKTAFTASSFNPSAPLESEVSFYGQSTNRAKPQA